MHKIKEALSLYVQHAILHFYTQACRVVVVMKCCVLTTLRFHFNSLLYRAKIWGS